MADKKFPNLKLKNVEFSDESGEEEEEYYEKELNLPLEKLNLGKKKKLLVLCLGGLLVRRVHFKDNHTVRGMTPDASHGQYRVFMRPFCVEFMKFCFERFEVGICHNIHAVLSKITGGMPSKLALVWGQDDCIDSGFSSLSKNHKPLFLKDLKKLWENKHHLSLRNGQFSASNTLLFDDEPRTSWLNPPNTAIFPESYKKIDNTITFLGPNGELREFLNGMVDADDVPSYVKDHLIGQPAIISQHPHWDSYAKVLRGYGKRVDEEGKKSTK